MERLYEEEDKILVDDWEWNEVENRSGNYSGEAKALAVNSGEVLVVRGEIFGPPSSKKFSFVLQYKNTAIRVWDFNDHHEGIKGGHKHKYRERTEVAYEPYSVDDVSTSDVNQALIEFLDECGIEKHDSTIHKLQEVTSYE